MTAVLVDTSVWVRFLRGEQHHAAGALDLLVATGVASVCGLVLCELYPLGGSGKSREDAERFFRALPVLADPPDLWGVVSRVKTKCVKSGVSGVGIPDLIVVCVALHNNAPLLSLDKHFAAIARAVPELRIAG